MALRSLCPLCALCVSVVNCNLHINSSLILTHNLV